MSRTVAQSISVGCKLGFPTLLLPIHNNNNGNKKNKINWYKPSGMEGACLHKVVGDEYAIYEEYPTSLHKPCVSKTPKQSFVVTLANLDVFQYFFTLTFCDKLPKKLISDIPPRDHDSNLLPTILRNFVP